MQVSWASVFEKSADLSGTGDLALDFELALDGKAGVLRMPRAAMTA
jgi:hypothetical protein